MEIFMRNIPLHCDQYDVKGALAAHLHGPSFFNRKANFSVSLHRPRQGAPALTGTFVVTDTTIARRFLYTCGSSYAERGVQLGQNRIEFSKGKHSPLPEVLDAISRSPWVDPAKEREQKQREQKLQDEFVSLQSIQFGWMCRDDVFSIESEARQPAYLRFDPKRREMHISVKQAYNDTHEYVIAIRQSSILGVSSHNSPLNENSIIFLQLEIPPAFFKKTLYSEKEPFHRLSTFPLVNNPPAIAYTSLALRLILTSPEDSAIFLGLCRIAELRNIKDYIVDVERRGLFSHNQLQLVGSRIRGFDWYVAYQLEALMRNLYIDATELLELVPKVQGLLASHSKYYVAKLLRQFSSRAKDFLYSDSGAKTISSCFEAFGKEFAKQADMIDFPLDPNLHHSLHVTITPTSMFLEGPFLDKSNRVIRRYDRANQECFLRVEFRDENSLQFRQDKDIDNTAFIRERIGPIMTDSLMIAGRKFKFLAYSQSALKEHSVWFVKMFRDSKHGIVTAEKIRESLGSFKDLWYDPKLMYCPARYGARLSQAFTATDAAVVQVDEILIDDDIKSADDRYDFTDGSGDMSEDIAREIWGAINRKGRGKPEDFPHTYQIRFQGSKGMLAIDYRLKGSRTVSLRPSMIKFDAPGSTSIEIVEAITKPTPYLLNRPLIMVLEDLGVPYEVFQDYQDQAVKETNDATRSLSTAAHLLQSHGLGASFRLPSTMLNLAKFGIEVLRQDQFYDQLLRVAVYHILRDLKNRARIPIPNAWTLVGVADTHHYLEENEIFACIKHPEKGTFYLEGPVLISRSPTVHPGDVQMATAIGQPPPDSCFAREPLPNTVVFSVRGNRPLSTCLGGGDLDGDLYNIIPLSDHPEFAPRRLYPPAEYLPAKKKYTPEPCTINDVAQFVMEYIISDVIGVVATNWLIIADQSERGIKDPDCLVLAQLHSDAVDYPKTGRVVEHSQIPRARFPKPDWSAPETLDNAPKRAAQFYVSKTAIGKLSRAINLDAHEPSLPVKSRRPARKGSTALAEVLSHELGIGDTSFAAISSVIEPHVAKFLKTSYLGDQLTKDSLKGLLSWFSNELLSIATTCSLTHRLFKPLTEEEVIVGTITQKTSQPRFRKDRIGKLRELTEPIVRRTREVLEGDESKPVKEYLRRAWMAWKLSCTETKKKTFGAKTFGWVSLGAVFDALKLVEEGQAVAQQLQEIKT